ncbi:gamma-glutamyl-gamma-aminobutyrate hydrolase family protein [Demequina sp.]|uniref:gamma-glutamyl-gamma-aminobutyrate hydrolase family protein n=1 Tax=Demequina sp. TaxID=2050685 RepID=UPI003D110F2D
MTAPVVGLTSYLDRAQSGVWDLEAVFLPWQYGSSFTNAGAAVAILPPQPATPDAVAAALDAIDGLVVTGGADLDPVHYGAEPHPENDEPRPVRDEWELALTRGALERGMPFFGICRGAQVLNVVLGGELIQHVPDVVGNKDHQGEDAKFALMGVTTVPGTVVSTLHPETSIVPVYHHQAVGTLGDGLVASAHSDYGIVEAIERPGPAFCLAVQWHPEQDDRPALFEAFVAAAAAYRAR